MEKVPRAQRTRMCGCAGAVMVYKDMELLWATRLAFPPAVLAVGTFARIDGLIVSLSTTGAAIRPTRPRTCNTLRPPRSRRSFAPLVLGYRPTVFCREQRCEGFGLRGHG